MWQRIKQLFKREETIQTVNFAELENWFDQKSQQKISELLKEIEQTNQELRKILEDTKQKVEILKKATLPNPNISEREKHFLEGNRETYAKSTLQLIDKIEKNQLSLDNYEVYFSIIDEELQRFVKINLRAFQILQEFLANESRQIGSNIRKIELLIQKQKDCFDKINYKNINEFKKQINEVQNKIERKKSLENNIEIVEQEINDLIEKRDVVYNEIKNLENNQTLQDLLKKLKQHEQKVKEKESEFIHFISQIEPSFKKYIKITLKNQELAEKYLSSPIQTLLDDKDFIIIKIVHEINSLIYENNIEIKDSRREKILELLGKINKDYFLDLKNQIILLRKEKEDISKNVNSLPEFILLHRKVEELKEINEKIEKEGKYIEELRREMDKIKPEHLIQNLENELNKFVKVKIVF